jgi:hypothetical protein
MFDLTKDAAQPELENHKSSYTNLEQIFFVAILFLITAIGVVISAPLLFLAQLSALLLPDKPSAAQNRIGEILVRKNLISKAEVEKVLVEQRASHFRLGELLLAKNLISPSHLEEALKEQSLRKRGFQLMP